MQQIRIIAFVLAMLVTARLLAQVSGSPSPESSKQRAVEIEVDLNKPIGLYKPIYSWFGFDEANYSTMENGKKLLRELHELSPVPVYIRVHHLLTSGNGVPELKWSSTNVYTEDDKGTPHYDFSIIDGIFDSYKAAGVWPMVELGFMPKDLAAKLPDRQQPYQVHYPKSTISGESNNPPRDYGKWRDLVRAVTSHLVARYGESTVRQWYFEVWNEPDIDYWHDTPESYWKLYDYAVAGVRAALPSAKVGGPASTGPGSDKALRFLDSFLGHIASGKSAVDGGPVPLDFVSFHVKGQPRIHEGRVTMGINKELIDADKGFEVISKYPRFRKLPIILSEADPEGCAACSSKVNPANNYRNGTLYPAYTAAAYKSLLELGERRRVDLLAMLSWSFEFEGTDYFEGFRSLATNGIDKPILNFFRMAALMTGQRVKAASSGRVSLDTMLSTGVRSDPDVDALATKSDHAADVLLWNYHDMDTSAVASPIAVTVRGIPAGIQRVLVTHYRIDESHSNAYTVWKAMGSPQHPTPEQYAELESKDGLQLLTSPAWLDVDHGVLTLHADMPRQSVSLVQLTW